MCSPRGFLAFGPKLTYNEEEVRRILRAGSDVRCFKAGDKNLACIKLSESSPHVAGHDHTLRRLGLKWARMCMHASPFLLVRLY